MTRPRREAGSWVDALRRQGIDAQALPLIDIGPAPDAAALAAARAGWRGFDALMFVSANAVDGFFTACPGTPGEPLAGAATRLWSTGPGTRQALLAAGADPQQIDSPPLDEGRFDSEALWRLVQPQLAPGVRVLIVRGAGSDGAPAGRDWLARQLEAAGAQVRTVAAYQRMLPRWGADALARARAGARDGSWWLFSSSEAIGNLRHLLPGQDWSNARALCTHARITDAAAAAGFGEVAQAVPLLDAVVAFLQSNP